MHAFKRVTSGTQVIHSTSLRAIANLGFSAISDWTSMKAKGLISGWMLLIPRIGVPNQDALRAFYSKDEVQLSDCVIGIKFKTKVAAFNAQRRIQSNWHGLLNLYRGTGARYTTIDRLFDWLYSIGTQDNNTMQEINELLRLA
jgi:hypothetical protein